MLFSLFGVGSNVRQVASLVDLIITEVLLRVLLHKVFVFADKPSKRMSDYQTINLVSFI